MNRKSFIKHTGLITAGLSLAEMSTFVTSHPVPLKNSLPRWKGFNLLDFFSPNPLQGPVTQEDHFKWMRDWGFDFVRIPIAYPHYLDIDRTKDITPDDVYKIKTEAVDKIDALVAMAHKYNMHVSLNLHRAPGYCINAGFHEPYNLWRDEAAQKAFYFHWNMWAKKYKNTSSKKISFDLVNEHSPIPEIADLNIAQSCRGYYPGAISHYKAPWANKDINNMPEPKWPGQVGDKFLSKEMLDTFYKPWLEMIQKGTGVHCGECGCWNKTPHDVFLAWFADVLDILKQAGIGFAIWNFTGDFGVLDSGRADVSYEDWFGHKLDKKFLDLMRKQ